jgi:membrane-associated protein
MELEAWIEASQGWPPELVWAALFGGALVEYVFPPFPGDTVVVAGAALVGANGWAAGPVWVAATAGSVVGAAIDLWIGRRLAAHLERLPPRGRLAVDRVVAGFQRWGPAFLAVNRFLPGIRASFFVAAGVAGLRAPVVLGWATVSAVAWNSLLVGLGLLVGQSVDDLAAWVERYQAVAWIVVGIGVVGGAAWLLRPGPRVPAEE